MQGQASLSNILMGEKSLYDFILECIEKKEDIYLPDWESFCLALPTFNSEFHFIDGMIDNLCIAENDEKSAKELFELFKDLSDKIGNNSITKNDLDVYFGKIYTFLITHITFSYVFKFTMMLMEHLENDKNTDDVVGNLCFNLAKKLLKAPDREAVKFAISMVGITEFDKQEREILYILGHSDEFALFVARIFLYRQDNEMIFLLAHKVKGWGRIVYLDYLEVDNEEKRKWVLLYGYDCDIGVDHVVLMCANKADLLGYIKEKGFDDKLYDATGDMLEGLNHRKVSYGDYKDSKAVVTLFIQDSINRLMDLRRLGILLELWDYLDSVDSNNERVFTESESKNLKEIMEKVIYKDNIDWESVIKANPYAPYAQYDANRLGIDIWDTMFEIAKNDSKFDRWFDLTRTSDMDRYAKIVDLFESRVDLKSLQVGPSDESGLDRTLSVYDDIEFIVQGLQKFEYSDEDILDSNIKGIEMLETLLQSPVIRSRNMALNLIESWELTPKKIIEIIKKNKKIEPSDSIKERYEKVLERNKSGKKYVIKQSPYKIETE